MNDDPRPPHNGTDTSIAAADEIATETPTMRARVLAYLKTRPAGATREQVCRALRMKESSACGRINELKRLGSISVIGRVRNTEGRTVHNYGCIPE